MVRKLLLFVFVITSLFCVSTKAQNVAVKASVDTSNYQVGDFINYTLKVVHPKEINIKSPSVKDSLKGVELIKVLPRTEEEKDGNVITTYGFVLAKYDSGDAHIPSIRIFYSRKADSAKQTVLSNPVFFTVRTLIVNPQAEIKDVKEPLKIPLDWKLILLWIALAIALAALAFYGYRYYKKKKAQRLGIIPEVHKETHEIALEALHQLEEEKLYQKGLVKEYHTRITDIIRKYFEKRFRIKALEITTGELLTALEQVNDAEPVLSITSGFLNNADLVKFARFIPMNNINEEMMKQAYEIVNRTIPVPEPMNDTQEDANVH